MVDKVLDFGKKLLERIKEWWNKFQPKQKTLIIGIGVVILLAMAILVAVLTKKQYIKDFVNCLVCLCCRKISFQHIINRVCRCWYIVSPK